MAKSNEIFKEAINDQERYAGYIAQVVPTITQAGGKIIAVDDAVDVLEGQWHGTRTVILEFDSADGARAWYDSAAYQAIIGDRHAAAEANAVAIRGM